ncbi:hypothetical protein FJZ31_28430 [Candidatus Poribacteria bacterium]|nr:hypothetical protein [Candidatus Poribacteria bacterium]
MNLRHFIKNLMGLKFRVFCACLCKHCRQVGMITWRFPMIIIFVLSIVSNAKADASSKLPTAEEIFSKAVKAESTVDYVGKRMVIRWLPFGSIVSEERIIHQAPSTHIMELLTPVDRMGPERGRDKDDKPDNRNIDDLRGTKQTERDRMRRMPPPPREMRNPEEIWSTDTQLLLRNYTVDVAFSEPIAGQNTYLLMINPKVAARPRKKVWLDAQHYIILRMEHYDITGKLKALSVYTTIDYDSASVARQLKQYSEKEQGRGPDRRRPYQSEEISIAEAEKQLGARLPQPSSYLPVGFQLQSTSMVAFRGNPSIHFRYTDGLTAFSLFASKVSNESEEKPPRPERGDRFGGVKPTTVVVKNTIISIIDQGHIKILRWEVSNLRFVLIGEELSQEEMVKVAEFLISQG